MAPRVHFVRRTKLDESDVSRERKPTFPSATDWRSTRASRTPPLDPRFLRVPPTSSPRLSAVYFSATGTHAAANRSMANKTYDDITRKTVPDPDGSIRPSREQVERAYDGTHTRTQDDLRLLAAVQAAVHSHADGTRVGVEVRDGRVELRGTVSQSGSITTLEDLVNSVPGVGSVENKLVVGS